MKKILLMSAFALLTAINANAQIVKLDAFTLDMIAKVKVGMKRNSSNVDLSKLHKMSDVELNTSGAVKPATINKTFDMITSVAAPKCTATITMTLAIIGAKKMDDGNVNTISLADVSQSGSCSKNLGNFQGILVGSSPTSQYTTGATGYKISDDLILLTINTAGASGIMIIDLSSKEVPAVEAHLSVNGIAATVTLQKSSRSLPDEWNGRTLSTVNAKTMQTSQVLYKKSDKNLLDDGQSKE